MSEYKKYIVTWTQIQEMEVLATSPKAALESAKISHGKCMLKYDYTVIKGDD